MRTIHDELREEWSSIRPAIRPFKDDTIIVEEVFEKTKVGFAFCFIISIFNPFFLIGYHSNTLTKALIVSVIISGLFGLSISYAFEQMEIIKVLIIFSALSGAFSFFAGVFAGLSRESKKFIETYVLAVISLILLSVSFSFLPMMTNYIIKETNKRIEAYLANPQQISEDVRKIMPKEYMDLNKNPESEQEQIKRIFLSKE